MTVPGNQLSLCTRGWVLCTLGGGDFLHTCPGRSPSSSSVNAGVSAALRKKSTTITNQVSGAVKPTHSPRLVNTSITDRDASIHRSMELEDGWGKMPGKSGRGAKIALLDDHYNPLEEGFSLLRKTNKQTN